MFRIVVIVFSVFLLSGLFACRKEPETTIAPIDPGQTNIERIEEVDIVYSDSAQTRVRIKGPVLLNHLEYSDPHQEFINGIQVEFFDRLGNVTSILTANYAVRYESRGITIIRENVVWRSMENKTLETPELTWDERQQKVFTQKFAVVTTPKDTVYSHGFEATQDFKIIKLNAIDGSMEVEEASPTQNTSTSN